MANYYFYLLNGGCWMGFLKKRVKIWRDEAQKKRFDFEGGASIAAFFKYRLVICQWVHLISWSIKLSNRCLLECTKNCFFSIETRKSYQCHEEV